MRHLPALPHGPDLVPGRPAGVRRPGAALVSMAGEATLDALAGLDPADAWHVVPGPGGHGVTGHVLVGLGGVYAVTSTWTGALWAVDGDRLDAGRRRDPLAEARASALRVHRALVRGRSSLDVVVRPVLVVWGPGAPLLPRGTTTLAGVLVLEGRAAARWRDRFDLDTLAPGVVEAVAARLAEVRAGRRAPATSAA